MTLREKQIEYQASEYADDSNNTIEWGDGWEDYNDFDQVFDAFKNGAKWADENPKPDTVNKHEFIEKAKAWVKNCFIETFGEGMADNIANEFEKYMEE